MSHWPPKIKESSATSGGGLHVVWEVDSSFSDSESPDEQWAQLGHTTLILDKDDREVDFPADAFAHAAGTTVGGSVTFKWTGPPDDAKGSPFYVSIYADGTLTATSTPPASSEHHAPVIRNMLAGPYTITIDWDADQNYDLYNVRYGDVTDPPDQELQAEVRTSGQTGSFTADHLRPGAHYHFSVQGCYDVLLGSSCSNWSEPVQVTTLSGPRQPFPIAPGGAAGGGSGLTAAVRGDEVDVFWVGPDGGIGVTFARMSLDGGRWQQPFPIAPAAAAREGSPVAAAVRGDQLDAYWIGPNGGIGSNFVNSQLPKWL
jgi:hypothetical protein